MSIIGTFTQNGEGFSGSIETLTLKANVSFETNTKKTGNAPDFRVFQIADSFTSEIGGAWRKASKDNGEYLSVSIDDPSFAERINCRLVKTGSEHSHTLYWERPRARD